MELMLIAAVVFCVVFVALGVMLWRRGAIDKKRAREELHEAVNHVREDVKNWRDKL